jgi:hypothetical protein
MRLIITPFACAVIISQLYPSVVTFYFLVILDILRKCYFSSLWHTTGLHNSLRGLAQSVLGDLPSDRQVHYTSLVEALEERFAPPNQMDLYRVQLKERRQKASETLPELGQVIWRLVNKAYPKAPAEVRETFSTEHVLDSLVNSEMRIRIKQSRPANLNEAICLAVELDALYKAEKKNEFGRLAV